MKRTSILLFLFCCNLVSGQDDQLLASWIEYAKSEVVVIAPAGLNLRDKPTVKSEILRAVPFGEKVKIIGSGHYGRDTVGTINFYYNASDHLTPIPISGYWLKVDCQGTKGYMFSAYLDRAVNVLDLNDAGMNREYVLLFPEVSCIGNYTYRPDFHWYGYYKTETGISIKKIDVSFYNLIDQEMIAGNTNKVVSSSDNKFLQFIIGTRERLLDHLTTTIFSNAVAGLSVYNQNYRDYSIDSLLKKCNLRVRQSQTNGNQFIEKLSIDNKEVSQLIGAEELGLDVATFQLRWCGDLDGDNKNDYIIQYGDKSSKTILYLSKPAEKGKLVKPVAVFYSGYCC